MADTANPKQPVLPVPARSIGCLCLVLAAWLGAALYAFGDLDSAVKSYWSPAIVACSMIAYVIVHGLRREGPQQILWFAVIVVVVGWIAEAVGISTGFPFGSYQYTDVMRPFIGDVPFVVLAVYGVMGYVSWAMARLIVGESIDVERASIRFDTPVVAAVLMVVWDLSMDPLRAGVEQRWIWTDGGAYFGIPLTNFAGWFVVTWVMFQSYAFYLCLIRDTSHRPPVRPEACRLFNLSVPLMYLAFPVEHILNPFVADVANETVIIGSSAIAVADIHSEIALITCLTMLPIGLFTARQVWREGARTGQKRPLSHETAG
jgi:putative membrane protein